MTISSVLKNLRNDQAAKVPSMRGYIKRVDNELQEGQSANYTITFVEAGDDVDGDNTSTYSYTFITTTEGVTTVTADKAVTIDPVLLQYFMLDTWEIGSYEDYEAVRIGSDSRW